jgi:ATP-dependent DNA ligase
MPFVDPMLACGEPKKDWDPRGFWMEEKYDGHRMIIEVTNERVTGWSRYGLERKLPSHMQDLREYLACGTYDGELIVPGQKSHNVVELTQATNLVFVAFDILFEDGYSFLDWEWIERHNILHGGVLFKEGGPVQLSLPKLITDPAAMKDEYHRILALNGEGLILKNPEGEYKAGKRPRNEWIKLKAVRTAVMEIIGFAPGKNGPFSRAVVEGNDLKRTTVKVLNDDLLTQVHQNPQRFIGRQLRIEYNERYADGSYRHPRWDHLLDEDNE